MHISCKFLVSLANGQIYKMIYLENKFIIANRIQIGKKIATRKFIFFLTPWAINTSYTQQIPTTVIPCSLHNVATATKNTVNIIGVHTAI